MEGLVVAIWHALRPEGVMEHAWVEVSVRGWLDRGPNEGARTCECDADLLRFS